MPASDSTDSSAGAADSFRAASEKIRGRADTAAKTFGTLATTAITAVGISKFGDIYPRPDGLYWPVIGIVLAFLAMIATVAFFTARLWRVNLPIVMQSNPDLMTDLGRDEEKDAVRKIYATVAKLNRARTLASYEAKSHRLSRIADRKADDQEAEKLRKRSATIKEDVLATEARAALIVIRHRAATVVRSKTSLAAFCLFALAALVFAVSADRLESARAGEIEVAKACADARAAHAIEDKLPSICGNAGNATKKQLPAAEVADAAVEALATARKECRAAARKTHDDPVTSCGELDAALKQALAN